VVYRPAGSHVEPPVVKVRLGGIRKYGSERGVVNVGVSKVYPYPHYKGIDVPGQFGDVALLKLKHPVPYTDTIRPICLPSPDVDLDRFKVCYATGFGKTAWNS